MLRRAGVVLGVVLGLLVVAFIAIAGAVLEAPGHDVGISWEIPDAEVLTYAESVVCADCEAVERLATTLKNLIPMSEGDARAGRGKSGVERATASDLESVNGGRRGVGVRAGA